MQEHKPYYCRIGEVLIKIHNTNNLTSLVIKDLGPGLEETQAEPDIELIIDDSQVHTHYAPKIYSAKGSMNFTESEFFVGYLNELDYSVQNLFNDVSTVVRIDKEKRNIKKTVKSLYKGKLNIEKDQILSYALFWYIMHLSLLKKGSAFIHAGVLNSKNGATIITGTGGCGKTSTLFKILENTEYSYIAEDFGIVDKNGITYYNPKPVSVYASDTEFGQTILRDHVATSPIWEKILWKVKRRIFRQNPMKKIPPEDLLKGRVSKQARVSQILYLIRNNDSEIAWEEVTSSELAERVLDASMRELKTLNELLLLMRANAPESFLIPSFHEIREETRRVYSRAFDTADKKIVYIPHKTAPADLTKYLHENRLI